jgi:hypothetical protein
MHQCAGANGNYYDADDAEEAGYCLTRNGTSANEPIFLGLREPIIDARLTGAHLT